MMSYRIACVIVTYNRKACLCECLEAILMQTYKPETVYIVDNASTDGTIDAVKLKGMYNQVKENISFQYVLQAKNEGGAGGFYQGIKTASEQSYDAVWVMDDDGHPAPDCLYNLQRHLGSHDYIAPIVISDKDQVTCSFVPGVSYTDFSNRAVDGLVVGWASPFNGILYSSRLIGKIGYPKKEMFIWGDETNYHYRAIQAGFVPVTDVMAKHYHPVDRQVRDLMPGGREVIVTNQDWKLYCLLRNTVYNMKFEMNELTRFYRALKLCLKYMYYHSVIKKDKTKNELIITAVSDGLKADFTKLSRYFPC